MALIQHHPRNGFLIKLDNEEHSEAPMEGNIQKLCLCLFVQVAALADDRGAVNDRDGDSRQIRMDEYLEVQDATQANPCISITTVWPWLHNVGCRQERSCG